MANDLCSSDFWNLFVKMHTFSIKAIDSALQAVKTTFVHERLEKSRFPQGAPAKDVRPSPLLGTSPTHLSRRLKSLQITKWHKVYPI